VLNQGPIFINGLSRGGTNILMNLLLSHPEVCMPTGETHKVFKGRARGDSTWRLIQKRLCYDLPVRVAMRQDIFHPLLLHPRKRAPNWVQRFVDRILYREKLRARHESHNRYKSEGVEYTREEIADSRLLCKNVNGLIYTADMFREMYPDAVFLGIVRNGLAVCEGHVRRGRTADEFARMYSQLVTRMVEDAARWEDYHVIRFEDMISHPVSLLHKIYRLAGLDVEKVQKVRLQLKATVDRQGRHGLAGGYDRQVVWYDLDDLASHFRPDVNENQIRQLSPQAREAFLRIAQVSMERLGYS
jgi:hypothetical protein